MAKPIAESKYMGRVAALRCVLCAQLGMEQSTRTTVHHVREGQGMQQRASNYLTVALCQDCHQGPNGLHGSRSLFKLAKWDEMDALAATIKELQQ